MIESLYSDARLYDLMYSQPSAAGTDRTDFYLDLAEASGGPVLELACGTGTVLLPIASRGIPCEGLDLSTEMLTEARAKFAASAVTVPLHVGDMTDFDIGRRFALIYITGNSLLHLHASEDIVRCFRAVRKHLEPGGKFVFDVFNPSVRYLAALSGARRELERFHHPERGEIRVDVEERYDAGAQVTRAVWYFSTESDPSFRKVSLEIRSIFPQELPLLVELGGFKLLERYGDFSRNPFTNESASQVCICEAR